MKTIAFVIASLITSVGIVAAQDNPPTFPGNYNCFTCQGTGGLGVPAGWTCIKSEGGEGRDCKPGKGHCTYAGGCVSLPTAADLHGLDL